MHYSDAFEWTPLDAARLLWAIPSFPANLLAVWPGLPALTQNGTKLQGHVRTEVLDRTKWCACANTAFYCPSLSSATASLMAPGVTLFG